jgi:hypothetical protein
MLKIVNRHGFEIPQALYAGYDRGDQVSLSGLKSQLDDNFDDAPFTIMPLGETASWFDADAIESG